MLDNFIDGKLINQVIHTHILTQTHTHTHIHFHIQSIINVFPRC